MKRILIIYVVLSATINNCFSQIRSNVEEKFEFTSIAFMLAGAPEYNDCRINSYKNDIISYFEKYKNDESIDFLRKLNREHRIGYNAITTVSDLLQIREGFISLQPQYTIPYICELDPRWNEMLLSKYLIALNHFYKISNFNKFYLDHRLLYTQAEERMNKLLAEINIEWFEGFFGKNFNDHTMKVFISLVNGSCNYSMVNGVLIGIFEDEKGLPDPNSFRTLPVLIHEWAHHFTNQIAIDYWPQMENAAETIYPKIELKINKAGYAGAKAAMIEWLNCLFSIMYFRDNAPEKVPEETTFLMHKGFIWMDRSVEFMDNFYANRERYQCIEDFMPQIIAFINYIAQQIEIVYREYQNARPFITNIFPANESDITGFEKIEITFSEPMLGSWGIQGKGTEDEDVKALNELIKEVKWSDDRIKAIIELDVGKINPNCKYGVRLFPPGFCSSRYFPLDEKCSNLSFKTFP